MAQRYDPYGSENQATLGQTVGDIASAPFRPSSYFSMYASFPGMWNTQKGIWVPGVGKSLAERGVGGTLERGWDIVKGNFATRSPGARGVAAAGIRGTYSTGKESLRRILSFGHRGGGYAGGKTLEAGRTARSLFTGISETAETINIRAGATKALSRKAGISTARSALENLGEKGTLSINVKSGLPTKGNLGVLNLPSKAKSLAGKGGKYGLNALRHSTALARNVLFVGKAASWVGMTMFAWDMAKMVGEPLGRAAVSSLDNALSEYQDRFMPEVGGRLELSYLSRGAATERQRAISAISKAYINGRAVLGTEAAYLQ